MQFGTNTDKSSAEVPIPCFHESLCIASVYRIPVRSRGKCVRSHSTRRPLHSTQSCASAKTSFLASRTDERLIRHSMAASRVALPNEDLTVRGRLSSFLNNVPVLCDVFVQSPQLPSAVCSVAWLHGGSLATAKDGWTEHLLVVGTSDQTTQGEDLPDCLLLCNAVLPTCDRDLPVGGDSLRLPKSYKKPFGLIAELPHDGDVDQVRSMPQHGALLATKSCGAAIHIYNISAALQSHCAQQQYSMSEILTGRSAAAAQEGDDDGEPSGPVLSSGPSDPAPEQQGLAWSPMHQGVLLATAAGGSICAYRLDALTLGSSRRPQQLMQSDSMFAAHAGKSANDVAFAGRCTKALSYLLMYI